MNSRLAQLENTVLELGTELYRIRSTMTGLTELQEQFIQTLKGLQEILDDKGLIAREDFEAAAELNGAMQIAASHFDQDVDEALSKLKKSSH